MNSDDRAQLDGDGFRLHFITGFVVLVTIIVVGNAVVTGMGQQMEELEETCDQKYGDDNWVLVPANSSERDPFFIGGQYVCVAKNSTRAQKYE